jgi:two-component system response regulator VanR
MADKKKILIVEDEKALQTTLYIKLMKNGFEPTVCADGQQAIDMLLKDKFDLILLDIILPMKDGYMVLEEKANTVNKDTPVIVMTNLSQPEHLAHAKKLGARDCYMKSQISLKTVMANIQNVLGFVDGPQAA